MLTLDVWQRLNALAPQERMVIQNIWDLYDAAGAHLRELLVDGILHQSCLPQLSYISNSLAPLTRVDFIGALPTEISFQILRYLDGKSLCHCAQVSKRWRCVADDDSIWYRMCTQHIDKKCNKCGWGLPLMHTSQRRPAPQHAVASVDAPRQLITAAAPSVEPANASHDQSASQQRKKYRRPWKEVYAERLIVERNWRSANYSVRDLTGHKDGIMTLYYDDCMSLLITGGYDHTLRAWNVQTGECLGIMKGHTRCVRGVQFDDAKIISCSMDRTLRIWSMRDFSCVRVIEGHTDGVVCLHFTDKILASGSVDGAIRVHNLATCVTTTLHGHTDWINKVLILPCKRRILSCSDDMTMRLWDIETRQTLRTFSGHVAPVQSLQLILPRHHIEDIEEEELKIVTGSLDHTVKIWDFKTGQTIRTLFGHVEGVWCVDADLLRVVSGSHDHTLKVWDIESGKCLYTIEGNSGSVNCCRLSDTKLISGDDNGIIKVRDFRHNNRVAAVNAPTATTPASCAVSPNADSVAPSH
ncbi:WD40-repeat-containing domain protein [Entophlyctis helioformis]|nr:WD40-repeat-containing domain protein [Entophlyctis helioformis]